MSETNFPVVCEKCKKEPCPYAGNEFAFKAIERKGYCPHNPKIEEKKEAERKSMGWKRSRNQ